MSDNIRRTMPLFQMGMVMQLTELSARQIRYYEEHNLVFPARTDGNRRLYSFNDVDRLLEIKSLIEKGVNLAGIKQIFVVKEEHKEIKDTQLSSIKQELSDEDLRKLLKAEIINAGRFTRSSNNLRNGDMSRFFH